ncbi:MAG: hypothetical protein QM706_17345 [Nitrospira sp.]
MWDYRLGRQASYDQDREQRQVIAESLKAGLTELAGLESRQENLILKAPMAGMIRDRADSLIPGRWIDQKLPIAYLVDAGHTGIDSLVSVDELRGIAVGHVGRFIPDDLTRSSLKAEVTEIDEVDQREFTIPYLASIFGGDVAVRTDAKGKLKAEVSVYRVRLKPLEAIRDTDQAVPGHVQIEGQSSSLAKRVWDHTVAVLIRESGFKHRQDARFGPPDLSVWSSVQYPFETEELFARSAFWNYCLDFRLVTFHYRQFSYDRDPLLVTGSSALTPSDR